MCLEDEIADACCRASVNTTRLPDEEVRRVVGMMVAQFARSDGMFIWEHLVERASVVMKDGWRLAARMFPEEPALLITEGKRGRIVFRFDRSGEVEKVLENVYGFEFCLMDEQARWLIVFNHHDVLIGAGDAKPLVEEMARSQQ